MGSVLKMVAWLLAIDHVSKVLVEVLVKEGELVKVVGDVWVTRIINTDSPVGIWWLWLAGGVMMAALVWRVARHGSHRTSPCLWLPLIIAGGLGNMIDGVYRGGGLDWIKYGETAIFNLADVMLLTGLLKAWWVYATEVRANHRQADI